MIYLSALAVVFLANVVPALAPPTWAILVLFTINYQISTPALIFCGVIAASSGRLVLALYFRKFSNYLPKGWVRNMENAGKYFTANQDRKIGILTLFLVSPISSAQLFEAAGLLSLNLKRIAIAFFSGRLITYSIYGFGAEALKRSSWGEIISSNIKSPWGIALQIVLLVGVYLLTKIDWKSKVRNLNNGNHSV